MDGMRLSDTPAQLNRRRSSNGTPSRVSKQAPVEEPRLQHSRLYLPVALHNGFAITQSTYLLLTPLDEKLNVH